MLSHLHAPPPISPHTRAGQTGYHPAGGLSRYNAHREGVVFSNGELLALGAAEGAADSRAKAAAWFGAIADIAVAALEEVAVAAGVPGPGADAVPAADGTDRDPDAAAPRSAAAAWVRSLGDIRSASQWHVKRYTAPSTATPTVDDTGTPQAVLLPLHTDPSLISVVIHDAPGTNPGCLGLQHRSAARGGYVELPHHGHAVATVLVGSLLEKISSGLFSAAKHRVLAPLLGDGGDGGDGDDRGNIDGDAGHGTEGQPPRPPPAPSSGASSVRRPPPGPVTPRPRFASPPSPPSLPAAAPRMAATFFFRPGPDYVLRSLPSPVVRARNTVVEMPYAEWKRRTAARYEASKKKHKPPRGSRPKEPL